MGRVEPDWAAALAYPSVKLHLYGKARARAWGEKWGTLTALASTIEAARDVALGGPQGTGSRPSQTSIMGKAADDVCIMNRSTAI